MAAQDEGTVTTALDTDVIIASWDKDPALSMAAKMPWMLPFTGAHWWNLPRSRPVDSL
jgi:hypothetical protein